MRRTGVVLSSVEHHSVTQDERCIAIARANELVGALQKCWDDNLPAANGSLEVCGRGDG